MSQWLVSDEFMCVFENRPVVKASWPRSYRTSSSVCCSAPWWRPRASYWTLWPKWTTPSTCAALAHLVHPFLPNTPSHHIVFNTRKLTNVFANNSFIKYMKWLKNASHKFPEPSGLQTVFFVCGAKIRTCTQNSNVNIPFDQATFISQITISPDIKKKITSQLPK